jgi:hypothetical protein
LRPGMSDEATAEPAKKLLESFERSLIVGVRRKSFSDRQ